MQLNNLLSCLEGSFSLLSLEETQMMPLLDSFLEKNAHQKGSLGAHTTLKLSLESLEKGSLCDFDAHVSDQACQVRAALIGSIYMAYKNNPQFQSHCEQAKKALITCQAQKGPCHCRVDVSLLTLMQSFLLTQTREIKEAKSTCSCCNESVPCFKEETDIKKLQNNFPGCGSNVAKKIISKTKKDLAETGASFLQKRSHFLSDQLLQKMLSNENSKLIQGRKELPCFYTLKMMIEIAKAENIPILIKVKKTAHLLEKSPKDSFDVELLGIPGHHNLQEKSCVIVIEGMRKEAESKEAYISKLVNYSLQELCETNASQHCQYSDKSPIPLFAESLFTDEKIRLEHLGLKAKEIGCSNTNMDLFCITHIFCDTFAFQKTALEAHKTGELLCLASK